MANFYIAKEFTRDLEGGFWNDPSSGWTYAGITRKYFPLWTGFKRLEVLKKIFYPGRQIPRYIIFKDSFLDQYVNDFYKNNFWIKILSNAFYYALKAARISYYKNSKIFSEKFPLKTSGTTQKDENTNTSLFIAISAIGLGLATMNNETKRRNNYYS